MKTVVAGLTVCLLLGLTPAFGRQAGTVSETGGTESATEIDGEKEGRGTELVNEETETESPSEAESESYSDVLIEEYDPESGENVAGAKMEVLSADGRISLYEFELYEDGYLIKGLKEGEYLLRETSPAKGRLPAEERTFSADGSEKRKTVSIPSRKERGSLLISATDENGNPLEGAVLELADSEGTVIDRFETTKSPASFKVAPGDYVIRTVSAPNGRRKPKDAETTVKAGEEETVAAITFRPSSVFLTVSAEDGTPSNKSGGRILNSEGGVVSEWTSGGGTGELLGLKAGTYEWEVIPETGYATPKAVSLEIDGNEDGKEFSVVLKKIFVEIGFVDSESGEPIEDAEISMKNDRGIEIESWKTDENPHEIKGIPTGSYMLEAKVPAEYATPTKFFIDVKDSEKKQKATAKASLTQTIFKRVDEEGELVGGCVIEAFDEKTGESVVSFKTESDMPVRIKGIPAGKYRAEETSTPSGFGKADPTEFEVSSDGGPFEVVMTSGGKEALTEDAFEEETEAAAPTKPTEYDFKWIVAGLIAAAVAASLALIGTEKKRKKKKK